MREGVRTQGEVYTTERLTLRLVLYAQEGRVPNQSWLGYEDCPLPCDLNGRKTNKKKKNGVSEQVRHPNRAGILNLGPRTVPENPWQAKIPIALIKSPKGCLTHKRTTTITHGNASHAFYHLVCCSPQLSPICASFKHTHTCTRHTGTKYPLLACLPASSMYLITDRARRHRQAAWLNY